MPYVDSCRFGFLPPCFVDVFGFTGLHHLGSLHIYIDVSSFFFLSLSLSFLLHILGFTLPPVPVPFMRPAAVLSGRRTSFFFPQNSRPGEVAVAPFSTPKRGVPAIPAGR